MSLIVYLNGSYISEKDAMISAFDSGFLYGDGVFESLRVYQKKNRFLKDHFDRLVNSAKSLGYKLNLTFEDLKNIIMKLVEKNNLFDAYIRVTLTRGNAKIGFGSSISENQTLFVVAKEHQKMSKEKYENGVVLGVAETRRNAPEAVNPQIKSISNLNSLLGKLEIKSKNVFEVIMLNSKDIVTECAAANIFWIKDQIVYTPDVSTGLLEGVTRKNVIDICKNDLNYSIETGQYKLEELLSADEVFITSTSLEIMPVVQIEDSKISNGKVGKESKKIHSAFSERLV